MSSTFSREKDTESKEEYMKRVAEATQEAIYNKTGELYPLETKKDVKKLYKMSLPWLLTRDEKTNKYTFDEQRLKDEIYDAKGDIKMEGAFAGAFFFGDVFGMMASASPVTGAMNPVAMEAGGALLTILAVPIIAWVRSTTVIAKAEKLLKVLNTPKANDLLDSSPQKGTETFSQG